MEQAQRRLVEHFRADRGMASITHADADSWVAALNRKYAPATARRTIKTALRNKLVSENVFTEFPIHVVCQWTGNSSVVAVKHYLAVRESDFERASQSGAFSSTASNGNE